jgi:apoptosis-inducing factor 3
MAHSVLTLGYTSTIFFWSAQGVQMRYCGTTAVHGFDEVIVHGSADPQNPKFTAFYVKDNKVVAVMSMGTDPSVSLSAELFHGISLLQAAR